MMRFLGTAAALALLATGPAIAADKVQEKENGPDGAEHGLHHVAKDVDVAKHGPLLRQLCHWVKP